MGWEGGRGSSAPSFSVWWSTEQLHKCHRKEHFDPRLGVVCPPGKYPCSAPSSGLVPTSPQAGFSVGAKGREGRGVGTAPVRAESRQCHLPAIPQTEHGHSWQSLEKRGCSERDRASPQNSNARATPTAECGAVISINWQLSSAQNCSWALPRSFAQSSIVSEHDARLCFPPLCPCPKYRGEINSSTMVSGGGYIVI